jgi:hypothetical protein
VQYNNAGAIGGATNVSILSGDIALTASTPASTTADAMITDSPVAARHMLRVLPVDGGAYRLQRDMSSVDIAGWYPAPGVTTVPGTAGFPAATVVGTATARSYSTTNAYTRKNKLAYVSAATAGSLSSFRFAVAQCAIGNGTGLGGFYYVQEFAISDAAAVAGARMFCGLRSLTSAATNVEPSTIVNGIGVGHGASDTTMRLYYGGSSAQTPIDLGVNFPANTRSADVYRLTLHAPATYSPGPVVYYHVERLGTAFTASGTLTGTAGVALPAVATLLNVNSFRTNNATALAVGLDIGRIYLEKF